MQLDEKAKRRPDWKDGAEVELGDGGLWHFRHPLYKRVPTVGRDGNFVFAPGRPTVGPDFDELITRMLNSEDGLINLDTVLGLAVAMLKPNYDLTPEDVATLLPWVPNDDRNQAMWQAVIAVANGNAVPKPGATG